LWFFNTAFDLSHFGFCALPNEFSIFHFRLTPQNAHQQPQLTVLCGPHLQGAQALNCARHLAMHTVSVTAFVPSHLPPHAPVELRTELNLLRMTKTTIVHSPTGTLATQVSHAV
jgi:enhancer of mRNA-decapping protein 3